MPDPIDLGPLLLRLALGAVLVAHGWNHIFGGGRIDGTARWFGSLGMRAPRLQAWLASLTELGAGVLLLLGTLTPLAAAAAVGVLAVAWVLNHRGAGFFVFARPTEGWEYLMVLILAALALAAMGPGALSVDAAAGMVVDGGYGLLLAAGVGVGAALLVLGAAWRPMSGAHD